MLFLENYNFEYIYNSIFHKGFSTIINTPILKHLWTIKNMYERKNLQLCERTFTRFVKIKKCFSYKKTNK